jgi:hypothetical protein
MGNIACSFLPREQREKLALRSRLRMNAGVLRKLLTTMTKRRPRIAVAQKREANDVPDFEE